MEMGTAPFRNSMTEHEARQTKTCTYCGHTYPLSAFRRRTGKRAGAGSRRGACRNCRQLGANKGEPMAGLASGPAWSGQRSVDAAAIQARDEGRASSETKDLSGASGIGKPRKKRAKTAAFDSATAASPKPARSPVITEGLATEPDSGTASIPAAAVAADSATVKRKRRRRKRKSKRPELQAIAEQSAGDEAGTRPLVRAESGRQEASPARKESADGEAAASDGKRPAAAHANRNRSAVADGRPRRHAAAKPSVLDPEDPSFLRTNRQGLVRMRGKTDKGRRWHQEVEMELAVTLVKEKAAVVVNRYTIRRLFSNKDFKRYILNRDRYTCYFCGSYGDTIDHLLPRAKGGHTTPMNCVCACNLCNQSKAAMDADEFMRSGIPEWNAAHQEEMNAIQDEMNTIEEEMNVIME